jgi:hypothetical protein
MGCQGAKERREGLIADMVALRPLLQVDVVIDRAQEAGATNDLEVANFSVGYLAMAVDRLAAAVIALAGPCCEDCEDNERRAHEDYGPHGVGGHI